MMKKRFSNDPADPMLVMMPAAEKIKSLEGQRILSALDEAIKKSDLITALKQVTTNLRAMSMSFGNTLVCLLEKHSKVLFEFENAHLPTAVNRQVSLDALKTLHRLAEGRPSLSRHG